MLLVFHSINILLARTLREIIWEAHCEVMEPIKYVYQIWALNADGFGCISWMYKQPPPPPQSVCVYIHIFALNNFKFDMFFVVMIRKKNKWLGFSINPRLRNKLKKKKCYFSFANFYHWLLISLMKFICPQNRIPSHYLTLPLFGSLKLMFYFWGFTFTWISDSGIQKRTGAISVMTWPFFVILCSK